MSSGNYQQNTLRNLEMLGIGLPKANGSNTRERLLTSLRRRGKYHQSEFLTSEQFRAEALDRWTDEGGR